MLGLGLGLLKTSLISVSIEWATHQMIDSHYFLAQYSFLTYKFVRNYIDTTEKILEILQDQQGKRNLKWAKGIENNFKLLEKMLSEITLYKRRRTMPRTYKDHSYNTLFFN
ncbi:unnamed protein product [Rhizophagus irregularis]|nr:unnamed protein product [Rhizophagus irregularis]